MLEDITYFWLVDVCFIFCPWLFCWSDMLFRTCCSLYYLDMLLVACNTSDLSISLYIWWLGLLPFFPNECILWRLNKECYYPVLQMKQPTGDVMASPFPPWFYYFLWFLWLLSFYFCSVMPLLSDGVCYEFHHKQFFLANTLYFD